MYPRASWIVELIERSSLGKAVPRVRKLALREALRVVDCNEALLRVLLDALCGSPYLGGKAEFIGDAILAGEWTTLAKAVGVKRSWMIGGKNLNDITTPQAAIELRDMAICVFQKSKKIQQLNQDRRRQLAAAILACTTREALINLLMVSLAAAQTLDVEARQLIANDVLEGQFHRLLLPDRFDCEERPRIRVEEGKTTAPRPSAPVDYNDDEDEEDCAICLGSFQDARNGSRKLRVCGHMYCKDCIQDWANRQSQQRRGQSVSCPLCRTVSRL